MRRASATNSKSGCSFVKKAAMNKTFRIVAIGVIMLLLILGLLILGHGSTSRAALAKYKAELRAKGEKLSFVELANLSSPERRNWNSNLVSITTKLGKSRPVVHPSQAEARKFTNPGIARPLWFEDAPLKSKRRGKKTGTWEQFDKDMEDNKAALEELRRIAKPSFADDGVRTNGVSAIPPVPDFVAFRIAAQWLRGEAESNMHQSRLADALQDLEAIVGLTERYRDEPRLVSQMIRVAVANLGLVATWDALQSTQWNESQLASLQQSWETVDLLDAAEHGFTGERAAGEQYWDMSRSSGSQAKQMMQTVRRGSFGGIFRGLFEDFIVVPTYNVTSINDDELFYLKSMQAILETIRAVKLNEPWQKAKVGVDKQTATIAQILGTPQKYRYLRSMLSLPSYLRVTQTALRAETERQMTVIAIALKRYQFVHGSSALAIDALVPELLKTVPIDHMSGLPFHYKAMGDKDFLLYSVGEDGVDDGGDASPGKGFWDGRDAVWPRAENRQSGQN
jgi:hypothetical protein